MAKFLKTNYDWILIFGLVLFFVFLYAFIGFEKHQHFQTFAFDTSVFDQQLYFVKDLKSPYTSLVKINGLGDHFQLLFLVFGALFYKIYQSPLMLFLMQALFGSLSALPLFLLTRNLLEKINLSKIAKTLLSLAICFSYLFSVSFQSMMFDEFHNEPLSTLSIILMIYFLYKRNNWFWVSYISFLLTKEIFGILGVPLGIYIWLRERNFKKAILTAILGVFTFVFLIFYLMPKIAGQNYYQHFAMGNSPSYILAKFENHPQDLITNFFDNSSKRQTIFSGFLSFSFLPVLSPESLILPFSSLAIRFYDDSTPRLWDFNNHYAAPFLPLLAVSSSFGLYKLFLILKSKNLVKIWPIFFFLMIFVSLYQDILNHGPVNSVFKKQFYQTQEWEKDDYDLISQVPKNVTIASQNSLLPHLSERDNFYLLPDVGDAKYIAIDLSDGPNKFAPLSYDEFRKFFDSLLKSGKFKIIWQKNQAVLLKKG